MTSTVSCTQTPQTITKKEYIYVTPPSSWLQEQEIPDYKINTNQDLLNMLLDLRELNEKHNNDKFYLKLWKQSIDGNVIELGE